MQGFNMGRYVPPELEGVRSFNQASGKKPTNRKADGSQLVRFECPFAVWCTNCQPEQIIGQGVRFNAEKKKVGNYYSTPIWSFRIKHTICGGWIEIRTDPKNAEYVVFDGGRRRDNGENKLLDGEILIGKSVEEKEQLHKDGAFGSLEKNMKDKEVVDAQKLRVEELRKRQERDWADPYELNKKIRKNFRIGRRQRQDDEKTGEVLQEKFGLGFDLVAPAEGDSRKAKLIDFGEDNRGGTNDRGIFDEEDPSGKPEMDGSKSKQKGLDLARQKASLQRNLKGNTRAKSDPFLKDQDPWLPTSRRKREEQPPRHAVAELLNEPDKSSTTPMTLVAYDSD